MNLKFLIYFLIIASSAITCTFFYFNIANFKIFCFNNKLFSSRFPCNNFKSVYKTNFTFTQMKISKISDISLYILNDTKIFNVPMILKAQRYYIPLTDICKKLYFIVQSNDNSYTITKENTSIVITSNDFTKNSIRRNLRGNLLTYNNRVYICISDIETIFDLKAVFNFAQKSIYFFKSTITPQSIKKCTNLINNIAMIRLEDFVCGDSNFSDKNQTKIKIIADYLYENNIKFHVAWIPRFKVPAENIDNDLLKDNNIINAGFVNLLDYLINRNGEIGLHGYTHQSENSRSAVGEELSKDVNNTINDTKKVLENSINTAACLNIPFTFFESPHYSATTLQRNIMNKYFQFIYEPYDSIHDLYKTKTNNLYVSTPLGYIENPSETQKIIDSLSEINNNIFHSFFYHPSIEINFIDFTIENNSLNIKYDDNSPLKQIVHTLKNYNYITIHIDQLIKNCK